MISAIGHVDPERPLVTPYTLKLTLFEGKTKRYAIAGADLKAVYTACCAIAALYMTNTGFRPAEIGDDGIGACAGPGRAADVPSSR